MTNIQWYDNRRRVRNVLQSARGRINRLAMSVQNSSKSTTPSPTNVSLESAYLELPSMSFTLTLFRKAQAPYKGCSKIWARYIISTHLSFWFCEGTNHLRP